MAGECEGGIGLAAGDAGRSMTIGTAPIEDGDECPGWTFAKLLGVSSDMHGGLRLSKRRRFATITVWRRTPIDDHGWKSTEYDA